MCNSKSLCLHCLKSYKNTSSCCGFDTYNIGYRARAPKVRAPKHEWRKFIFKFIHSSENKGQLKKIISLRKEYGLPTLDQENKLNRLVETHEEQFDFLDIKHHKKLLEVALSYSTESKLHLELDNLIAYHEMHKIAKVEHNKEYFLVPIYAGNGTSIVFPSDIEKYEIYKVRSKRNGSGFDFIIKSNKVVIRRKDYSMWRYGNRYAITQRYLVFSTKENALAFRYRYLELIIPFIKSEDEGISKILTKKANIDYSRVVKKAPELLI